MGNKAKLKLSVSQNLPLLKLPINFLVRKFFFNIQAIFICFSGNENIFWKKELNLKSLGSLTGNDFEFRERERQRDRDTERHRVGMC